MSTVEIRVVANGYIVMPPTDPGYVRNTGEMQVFQTFGALVEWLEKNVKRKEEQE